MCGLMGVLAPEIADIDYEIMRDLTVVSILRGFQGAGVCFVNKKGDAHILRSLQNGAVLVCGQAYRDEAKKTHTCVFGHTRWPTRGYIDLMEHVHPHNVGNIIGVHNGTMEYVMGKKPEKDESDSRKLFEAIAEHGIKKTIEESKGTYALTWMDRKDNTLHFLRNYERPLHFGHFEGDDTIYWASEPKFLECVLARRSKNKLQVTSMPIDTHYVYELNNKGMPKVAHEEAIHSTWRTASFIPGGTTRITVCWDGNSYAEDIEDDEWAAMHAEAEKTGPTKTGTGGTRELPFEATKPGEPLSFTQGNPGGTSVPTIKPRRRELRGYYRTFGQFWVSHKDLIDLLGKCCSYCGDPTELDDFLDHKLKFVDNTDWVCHKCWNDPTTVRDLKSYNRLPDDWPNDDKPIEI